MQSIVYEDLQAFLQNPQIIILTICVPTGVDQQIARKCMLYNRDSMIIANDGDPRVGKGLING